MEILKQRYNLVLILFAVTGSSTLYVKKGIFHLLGITNDTDTWLRIVLYILVILPVYNVLLLIVGFLFGQFKFAWEFEKKMFGRFFRKKKTNESEQNEKTSTSRLEPATSVVYKQNQKIQYDES